MTHFDDDMPKAKKGQKSRANGFLMYLIEFRNKEADKGNRMEMIEAQQQAGENWKVNNKTKIQKAFTASFKACFLVFSITIIEHASGST